MLKGEHNAPFFCFMKKVIATLLFCYFTAILFAQQNEFTSESKINWDNLVGINPINSKKITQENLEKKINLFVFCKLHSYEGELIINELKKVTAELKNFQVYLVSPTPSPSDFNLNYYKVLLSKSKPTFPIILDKDSTLIKLMQVEETPSIVVIYPTGKIYASSMMDDFINGLIPYSKDILAEANVATDSNELYKLIYRFKEKKKNYQRLTKLKNDHFVISDNTDMAFKTYDNQFKETSNTSYKLNEKVYDQVYDAEHNVLFFTQPNKHMVSAFNLTSDSILSLIGNQKREEIRIARKSFNETIAYPTGLGINRNDLYVSCTGSHQIWNYNLSSEDGDYYVGDGMVSTFFRDGFRYEAGCLYPTKIVTHQDHLFTLDEGYNLIRKLQKGKLNTPAFNWDLNHINSSDIIVLNNTIWILDSYLKKISIIDLTSLTLTKELMFESVKSHQFPVSLNLYNNQVLVTFSKSQFIMEVNSETEYKRRIKLK